MAWFCGMPCRQLPGNLSEAIFRRSRMSVGQLTLRHGLVKKVSRPIDGLLATLFLDHKRTATTCCSAPSCCARTPDGQFSFPYVTFRIASLPSFVKINLDG